MTPEDLAQISAIVAERLDRAVEAFTANLSEVRQELLSRMAELGIRLDTLERRFDSFHVTLMSVDARMGGLTRQADRFERDNGATLATQAAQQRAFDALVARVAKLERELHPGQQ